MLPLLVSSKMDILLPLLLLITIDGVFADSKIIYDLKWHFRGSPTNEVFTGQEACPLNLNTSSFTASVETLAKGVLRKLLGGWVKEEEMQLVGKNVNVIAQHRMIKNVMADAGLCWREHLKDGEYRGYPEDHEVSIPAVTSLYTLLDSFSGQGEHKINIIYEDYRSDNIFVKASFEVLVNKPKPLPVVFDLEWRNQDDPQGKGHTAQEVVTFDFMDQQPSTTLGSLAKRALKQHLGGGGGGGGSLAVTDEQLHLVGPNVNVIFQHEGKKATTAGEGKEAGEVHHCWETAARPPNNHLEDHEYSMPAVSRVSFVIFTSQQCSHFPPDAQQLASLYVKATFIGRWVNG